MFILFEHQIHMFTGLFQFHQSLKTCLKTFQGLTYTITFGRGLWTSKNRGLRTVGPNGCLLRSLEYVLLSPPPPWHHCHHHHHHHGDTATHQLLTLCRWVSRMRSLHSNLAYLSMISQHFPNSSANSATSSFTTVSMLMHFNHPGPQVQHPDGHLRLLLQLSPAMNSMLCWTCASWVLSTGKSTPAGSAAWRIAREKQNYIVPIAAKSTTRTAIVSSIAVDPANVWLVTEGKQSMANATRILKRSKSHNRIVTSTIWIISMKSLTKVQKVTAQIAPCCDGTTSPHNCMRFFKFSQE